MKIFYLLFILVAIFQNTNAQTIQIFEEYQKKLNTRKYGQGTPLINADGTSVMTLSYISLNDFGSITINYHEVTTEKNEWRREYHSLKVGINDINTVSIVDWGELYYESVKQNNSNLPCEAVQLVFKGELYWKVNIYLFKNTYAFNQDNAKSYREYTDDVYTKTTEFSFLVEKEYAEKIKSTFEELVKLRKDPTFMCNYNIDKANSYKINKNNLFDDVVGKKRYQVVISYLNIALSYKKDDPIATKKISEVCYLFSAKADEHIVKGEQIQFNPKPLRGWSSAKKLDEAKKLKKTKMSEYGNAFLLYTIASNLAKYKKDSIYIAEKRIKADYYMYNLINYVYDNLGSNKWYAYETMATYYNVIGRYRALEGRDYLSEYTIQLNNSKKKKGYDKKYRGTTYEYRMKLMDEILYD